MRISTEERVIDDYEWKEADINSHAVFMGYMSMAVRGLGFMVVTWTTVVLLGGFVSTLKRKDFWCLTAIILIETAGAFDIFLKEKLGNIWSAGLGLFATQLAKAGDPTRITALTNVVFSVICCPVCCLFAMVYTIATALVTVPLVGLHMYGLYVSSAISLWRLIQHDYGNTDGEGNMRPALDVLYSLALFQGVVFASRANSSSGGKKIVQRVAKEYEMERQWISDYMDYTMDGCEKDPTFAKGRNLVTYSVELMESRSLDRFLSGARILDAVIRSQSSSSTSRVSSSRQGFWTPSSSSFRESLEQHIVIKHMIDSASTPSHVLHKLLQALDWRSPCNRETRECASRIVAYIAGDIRLEQFPRGIEYISSLIVGTFEDYKLLEPYKRDWLLEKRGQDWFQQASHWFHSIPWIELAWQRYVGLFLEGHRIIVKLATNENNCRFMADTPGLLSNIMAPLTFDLLHNFNHSLWQEVVDGSLQVVHQLVSAPGETGAKLRRQISSSSEATSTMGRILKCKECETKLQQRAMEILTRLDMDTESTQDFLKTLIHTFTRGDKKLDTTRLAGEALAKLCFQGASNNARIILAARDDDVTSLSQMLLDNEMLEGVDRNPYRIIAAEILKHLCVHCTNDDDCYPKLKEAMTDVMPKILSGILLEEEEATQERTPEERRGFSSLLADLESQLDDASQDDGWGTTTSSNIESQKGHEKRKLQSALLSLCLTVLNTFIGGDPDQARQFSATDACRDLPRKLKKMVETNSTPRCESVRFLKLTSKMVIAMVKHGGSNYPIQDIHSLVELTQALLTASKQMDMVRVESSMYFARDDSGATIITPDRSTTASLLIELVREVTEIVTATYGHPQESEIMDEPATANGNPE